jgi:gliding motility-associated-like protein
MDISPVGVYTFTWPTNTSFIADSAFNLVEGSYFVSFTDGICTGDTTVIVSTTSPPVDIISNVTATQCDENTGVIEIANTSGGNPPYTFTIDNGLFTPSIFFDSLGQGTYTISVLDANNCVYEEQIQVPQFAGPSLIQVEFNNPNCGLNNGSLLINGTIGGNGPFVYTFNNLISNTLDTIQNIGVGSYNLTVVDANGCAHNQLENFVMTAGDYSIRIPNVLTANSDQTNDLWTITTKCVESIDCIILNRWGDRIYEFYEIDGGWDGKTSSGNEVVPGVYFYKLVANYFGGASEEFHGHITLIRN